MPEISTTASILLPIITAGTGLVGGLGGVWLGAYLTNRREKEKAAKEFIKSQLADFYGPLLSMRKHILAYSYLRVKIQQSSDSHYMDDLLQAGAQGPEAIDQVTDTQIPSLLTMIRDEEYIFRELQMPLYRDMITVFREKMWLAEVETRAYFTDFFQFVEVWERIIRKTLPSEIAPAIGHTEAKLHPFYEHLESTHDRLRRALTE